MGGRMLRRAAAAVAAMIAVVASAGPSAATGATDNPLDRPGPYGIALKFDGLPSIIPREGLSVEFSLTATNPDGRPHLLRAAMHPDRAVPSVATETALEVKRNGAWEALERKGAGSEAPTAAGDLGEPVQVPPYETVAVAELRLTVASTPDDWSHDVAVNLVARAMVVDADPGDTSFSGKPWAVTYGNAHSEVAASLEGFPVDWVLGGPAREFTVHIAAGVPLNRQYLNWRLAWPGQTPTWDYFCAARLEALNPTTLRWEHQKTSGISLPTFAAGPPTDRTVRLRLALAGSFPPSDATLLYGVGESYRVRIETSPAVTADTARAEDPSWCLFPKDAKTAPAPRPGASPDTPKPNGEAAAGPGSSLGRKLRYGAAGTVLALLAGAAFVRARRKRTRT